MGIEKSLPRSKEVEINEEIVKVNKLGMLKWADVARKFDNFLGLIFDEFDNMTEQNWIERFPKFVADNIPVLIDILEIATPVERKELEETVGIDEFLELCLAVVEVNNLLKAVDKVKNLMTLVNSKK
jgi:hypothetical protein